jgi:hypothetical protein
MQELRPSRTNPLENARDARAFGAVEIPSAGHPPRGHGLGRKRGLGHLSFGR